MGVAGAANFSEVWNVTSAMGGGKFATAVMGCGDVDGDGTDDIAVGHAALNSVHVLYMSPAGDVAFFESVRGILGTSRTGASLWCGPTPWGTALLAGIESTGGVASVALRRPLGLAARWKCAPSAAS